ncbi:MAG TPA: tRNA (adenosine(37)-N6)-threonylcarbamoyltransferase complex dimerization subunit type 1 TsaB [Steroidobacteraceae bacterium]|jgi:tRNA threonylcarbamoyladenosine biosynthesis protein TsaB|nr:tRNA (adenosine(37)-N6)-threonylcarbamoyltransferase complex dimerization subunit type 1 TsaB [Steroidobacteraceae bacterium]
MKIIALDTASGFCSAALLIDGELRVREQVTRREHGQLILPMIDSLLREAGVALSSLDAVAFGRGPGSFTGLRIAASVTQGLAFGANLPVLPVSDLRALAQQAFDLRRLQNVAGRATDVHALACMDARMREVYWSVHRPDAAGLAVDARERVSAPTAVSLQGIDPDSVFAAGCGLSAYAAELAVIGLSSARSLQQAEPHARDVARLAAADFAAGLAQDASAALPVYLRDDVAQVPPP